VPSAFSRLWAAYAASTLGTWIAFDAFPLIAVLVLHAGPAAVSALAATGLAMGALVAVPLGPWVERRRKRRVMVATDLARCALLLTIPTAYALGALTLAQLFVVAPLLTAADIAFRAASGAYLKALLPPERLLEANARLEATLWTATAIGPPAGGAAIGLLGPMVTVLANAASFVASAVGLATIREDSAERLRPKSGAAHAAAAGSAPRGATQPAAPGSGPHDRPAAPGSAPHGVTQPAAPGSAACGAARAAAPGSGPHRGHRPAASRRADVLVGWRTILGDPFLRRLFANTVLVNGLILATAPLLAVLMLGDLGFSPLQYALAFGAPCVGGLLGARLSRRLVARFGRDRVLRRAGALRACWSVGLAFVGAGPGGLVLVLCVQLGLVTTIGVFNPVSATARLEAIPADRVARTLAAWTVTGNATTAALTLLWGGLAALAGPLAAIAAAGVLLLATPLSLPSRCPRRPTG
jgi:MFS family permease